MDVMEIKQIILCCVLILALGLLIFVIVQREKSKRNVRRMAMPQKIQLLNELAEPFGFCYVPKEDVFTTKLYAWQRKQGYEALFDGAAAGFNMVIDAWPVYFDYEGRTWLIEFWKGQYGINTGGEVGIYHAKEIVPKIFYSAAHFDAVTDEEMPEISCTLERREKKVYCLCGRHWWLTGFEMGTFSKPKDLRMMTTIIFREPEMAQAFYEGLVQSGRPKNKYRLCKNEVYVRMDFSVKISWIERLHRYLVQMQNCSNCFLYRVVTRPFGNTVDRMLFLYFQLPSCFRRMLRLSRKQPPRFLGRKKGRCR